MTAPEKQELFSRLVFIGGPPRSGTTLAMRMLEMHPRVLGVSDDHVHESWILYYYGDRTGLVADLRAGVPATRVRDILWAGLVHNGRLENIAAVPHTADWPVSEPPQRPDGRELPADGRRRRRACAIEQLPANTLICLKSPEICHVLPELAGAFPRARFVLVFRALEEIAESMFRMGSRVSRLAVFHRRWREEKDAFGRLIPPPGVPCEWHGLWREASDFGRCVVYAAAYLKAMAEGVAALPADNVLVYDHGLLRRNPRQILSRLARFLEIDFGGFVSSLDQIRSTRPELDAIPREELTELSRLLQAEKWLELLKNIRHQPAQRKTAEQ